MITAKIHEHLKVNNISFVEKKHEPTFTSEESALVRGEELKNGAKAILMKADDKFVLLVISAAQKLDSKKIKLALEAKKTRFATSEELLEKTGLVPGSVPPFGMPILPFELYIDESIVSLERVAFNSGSLTSSVIMSANDYLNISGGKIVSIT